MEEESRVEEINEEEEVVKDEIFLKIAADDVPGVSSILGKDKTRVEVLDEHGMTPFQHAAYKGNKQMCQVLLDYGADVNGGKHNNGYTALHFAALSGNASLCQLILQKGARASAQNSVNRTAAQMAAFVGNHHCVATINSFVDFQDVEFFTVPRGSNKDPKLNPLAASSLHSLIMQVNFHPVKVALTVKKSSILLSCITEIGQVLEEMSEREIKKTQDPSEIVAFKLHMLSFFVKNLKKQTDGDSNRFEDYVKSYLRMKIPGGISESLEILLRQGVREFRFHETTIMQQLVTSLTHTKVCEEPGAWSIICSLVNGQKGFRDNDPCATCGEERGSKKCSRCHFDAYCDQECQRLHWFVHKKYCKQKAEEYAAKASSQQVTP